jgi:signal transduction histidine kinase
MGLRSMRERAAAAGIDLDIRSALGQGTTVTASAPLAPTPTAA